MLSVGEFRTNQNKNVCSKHKRKYKWQLTIDCTHTRYLELSLISIKSFWNYIYCVNLNEDVFKCCTCCCFKIIRNEQISIAKQFANSLGPSQESTDNRIYTYYNIFLHNEKPLCFKWKTWKWCCLWRVIYFNYNMFAVQNGSAKCNLFSRWYSSLMLP